MTALQAFDPWAVLAGVRAGALAPNPPKAPNPAADAAPCLGGLGRGGVPAGEAEAAAAASPAPVLTPEAAYLLHFAEEAYAALVEREPDPIEAEGNAADDGDADAAEGAGG